MRWLLAGLLFALAVGMAVGTAAIRAENAIRRNAVEWLYRDVSDRIVEFRRLSIDQLDAASPEQLALAHWRHVERELVRRQESQQ